MPVIRNCKLYNAPDSAGLVDILVENHAIAQIGASETDSTLPTMFDARGRTVIPGMIDVHIHGAGGAGIADGSLESLQTLATTIARQGTTSFLGTTLVTPETSHAHLAIAGQYVGQDLGGANFLGIHLEGPFINRKHLGGIHPSAVYPPTEAALTELIEMTNGTLRMMTLAPELDGGLDMVARLIHHDIIPSFGHSHATYEETRAAFDAGITHVTHIFNTMPSLHHRNPGPIPAIFERPEVTVQIISDGVHLDQEIVNFIYRQLGGERCVLITDGMFVCGLPEGRYEYYGREFDTTGGAARYLDGTLIGSTRSLHQMMTHFMAFTGCSLETAVNTVTIQPAKVLGIAHRKGVLEAGKDADIVVLDRDGAIWATVVGGTVVYRKELETPALKAG
ncbi:MAG: N-acetylglucosamine-6-phosphate deacetylase [Candidatus Marinimicrobia bacterium]|nr:N-acetylglucosamine-6-phosphate deacetylase [Candidatus Neomarinimicrobiota bacterium]